MGHAGAHGLHHASAFHAQCDGQVFCRVHAASEVDIDVIEANCMVAHERLARAGLAHMHLHQVHHAGATGLTNLDCLGHAVLL